MPKINVEKTQSLTGHKDCLYSVAQGEAAHLIYTSGADGLVVRWDLNAPEIGKLVAKVDNSVYAMSFDENEEKLYIGHNFNGIHVLDLKTLESVNSSKLTAHYIFDLVIIGNKILCACGDGVLIVLDKSSLKTIKKIKISEKSLRTIDIHPTDQLIAIGSSDHHLYVLDADDLSIKKRLSGHTNSVFTTKFHPRLPYLLSAGRDAHLKIWNTLNWTVENDIIAHMYAINNLQFSPEARYFASCSMDKSIKLWDATTFKLLKVIDKARHAGHGTSVNKLLWTKHHNALVSVSDDRQGAVWNIQTII